MAAASSRRASARASSAIKMLLLCTFPIGTQAFALAVDVSGCRRGLRQTVLPESGGQLLLDAGHALPQLRLVVRHHQRASCIHRVQMSEHRHASPHPNPRLLYLGLAASHLRLPAGLFRQRAGLPLRGGQKPLGCYAFGSVRSR